MTALKASGTFQISLFVFAVLELASLALTSAQAQLRGHGGPVRALAVSSDGQIAVSGSFDSSAIRWSLTRDAAEQVGGAGNAGIEQAGFE